ncbi:MAG: sensor histidine kinase [Turicibacter sp.]|uniref:histidine kinase n=1 Tax=Turicibacter faecis TaxID=2963365 RepID=A0ABN6ZAU6_9FIRM|nr:sensor histidine kinase [Turicibacter sp. TS3]MCI8700705.1 sensor histidine kinase [Turicibacter sp.]MCI9351099.1 sensor histidine kinase [Turicibacter sp.]NCE78370.1 sensor histidine kinase [Turicibacter sp. TS3]BEH90184.1 two-component sensor histidine kinase [Turicibacter sp. TC023]
MATKLKNNKWFCLIVSFFVILGLSLGMMATYPKIATYVKKNQEGYYDQYDMYSQITIKNYLTYIEALDERHNDFIGLAKDLYDDKGNSRNLGAWCETLFEYYTETDDIGYEEYIDEEYSEGGNEYSVPTVAVDYRRILKTINPQLARELADVPFEQLTEEQLVQVIECLLSEMISEEIRSLRGEYHLSELDSIVRETKSESEADEATENPSFSTEELEKDKNLALLLNELSENDLKELQKEYQYFIRLDYDAAGRLSIPYFYGESGKSSQQFAYESLKETSNPYFMSSELAPIKNMTFIYGIPKGSTAGFDYGSGYYATSTISIFYESIVVLLLTGVTILIPLAGLNQFKLIKGWFKWPLEIVSIISTGLIGVYLLMIELIHSVISNPPFLLELSEKFSVNLTFIQNLSLWFMLLLVTFMTLLYFKQLIVQGGRRTMRQNCWCYRLGRFIYRQGKRLTEVDLKEENTKKLALFIFIQAILVSLCCFGWFFGVFGVIIYSVGLYIFLRKHLLTLQQNYATLSQVTEALADGNLEVEMNQDLGIFNAFKEEIMAIQDGFKKAVNEEVRSQKMRSDLIANVSHDLKTPLTSIITYTDLLKDETLSKEKREQYLQTLDQKAQRLKVLIEDLFEMSKASSGNITMNLQEVEVTSLMKQTLLELEDKIQDANLMIRRQFPAHKVILKLDSERTFRVFDNLILNMTKYAMPGTRAYIEILDQSEVVQIVFKNMSADELCVSAQELTERFVRGDQSRHTEGSGLGLAISKSFVELQGGSLDIQIDGDLFKVIITFTK